MSRPPARFWNRVCPNHAAEDLNTVKNSLSRRARAWYIGSVRSVRAAQATGRGAPAPGSGRPGTPGFPNPPQERKHPLKKSRALWWIACALSLVLAGCSLARQVTTKRLDFTQNIIPERNGGIPYNPGQSDTNGPIGPTQYDIVITGEVKDKYDKYHGGVDYAYFTYRVRNVADAPIRLRLWAVASGQCPPVIEGEVPAEASQLLDINVPARQTLVFSRGQGGNIELLRRIVENVLQRPDRAGACIYVQAESEDKSGTFVIEDLSVVGRAHGSLF